MTPSDVESGGPAGRQLNPQLRRQYRQPDRQDDRRGWRAWLRDWAPKLDHWSESIISPWIPWGRLLAVAVTSAAVDDAGGGTDRSSVSRREDRSLA